MKNIIYGLVDPRTLLVRYVGKSTSGMKRPKQHAMPSRMGALKHVSHWVRALLAAGLNYTIVVFEEVAAKEDLLGAERYWISFGRACDWPLTNLTDGGDGSPGRKHTAESRQKISAFMRARKLTPEHRAKIGAARVGKTISAENREKMAAALRGRKLTPEHRAKMSYTGRKHTAATIAKMSETHRRRHAAKRAV